MSDQTTTPTGQQAGQPAIPAQGQAVPAQPSTDPVEEQFRQFQSRADKYAKSVEERLKRAADAFADTPTTPPAQGAQVMGGTNPSDNTITQWARNAEATFGVSLDPTDAESSLLFRGQTPDEYMRAYLQALGIKKARTSQAPAAPAANASIPASVTPTTAGGTGAATNLEAEYREKLKKIRKGDVQGFHNLQTEMRKKGLNV